MEIKGMFACGLEYEGQRHRSFTLRLPTMADVENAIEAAQAETKGMACAARIDRHKWAACLSVDGIPAEKMSARLLAGMASREWGILKTAEDELVKKLEAASAAPAENCAEPSPSPGRAGPAGLHPRGGAGPDPAGG